MNQKRLGKKKFDFFGDSYFFPLELFSKTHVHMLAQCVLMGSGILIEPTGGVKADKFLFAGTGSSKKVVICRNNSEE